MQRNCVNPVELLILRKVIKTITISQIFLIESLFQRSIKIKMKIGGFTELCDFLKPTYDYEIERLSMTSPKI